MKHFIKLTKASDGGPTIFIAPWHIKALEPGRESTTVYCGAEDVFYVRETPEKIDVQVDLNMLKPGPKAK